MCHKLLQIYGCGHLKLVCTTPCPHALDTAAMQAAQSNSDNGLSRSDSTISSATPSTMRSDLDGLPSQQWRSSVPSPLRMSTLQADAPAFRFVAPGQSPTSPSSSLGSPPAFTPPSTSPTSPVSYTSSSLLGSPSHGNLTGNDSEPLAPPNYCFYHFPRYLPQSPHPCLECYMRPEWEGLRKRYVKVYIENHQMDKREDAEKMSGIERLAQEAALKEGEVGVRNRDSGRAGLLNVFVDGDESAGRLV